MTLAAVISIAKPFLLPLATGAGGWLIRHLMPARDAIWTAVAATSAFWLLTIGVGLLAMKGDL